MDMLSDEDVYVRFGKSANSSGSGNSQNCIRKCDILPDCSERPELFCKQCDKIMCKVCQRYHDSFQKGHDIESLSGKFTTQLNYEKAKQFAVVCRHYSQKHLNLYCMHCETLLCKGCATEVHGEHNIVSLDIAIADTKVFYEKVLDDCKKISAKTSNSRQEIKTNLKMHDEIYEETVDQFSEFVEKLKNQLDKKKTEQIAILKSKADSVRSSMQMQLTFWQGKLEAEKHLSFLINLFDKKESRTQWLVSRKSFRSMWGLIKNQHPPPYTYSGVASFSPSKSFMRCIEEMALGTLHIALNKNTNSDVCLDTDDTVTSGYAESDLIDLQSVRQLEGNVSRNDTAVRFFEYTGSNSDIIRKTVLKFEGANNCSDVTFDHLTKTLQVSVKDKEEKRNNTTEKQITKDVNLSSESYDIYDCPSVYDVCCYNELSTPSMTSILNPVFEPQPRVPKVEDVEQQLLETHITKPLRNKLKNDLIDQCSTISKGELVSESHDNLCLDGSHLPATQQVPLHPPPVPPRRQKKIYKSKSSTSLSVIDSGQLTEIKDETPPIRNKNFFPTNS